LRYASLVTVLKGEKVVRGRRMMQSNMVEAELLVDECKETAVALWIWANAWFAGCALGARNLLIDNGRSDIW
jgi:hypothetical protein